MPVVRIPMADITDWSTFHDVFARSFRFSDFYARNMDAWVDCMACADDSGAGLIAPDLVVAEGDVLTLHLGTLGDFAERCPEQYAAIVECTALVNHRRIDSGDRPILALSFYK